MSYENVVVKKPWGYEYLVYENDDVGLWLLRIESGQSTSMHCHPKKNTGLIVLNGTAQISFLNNSFTVESPDKMMIRRGLFHSTKAASSGGVFMFEIESPKIKNDLVRLRDKYGRKAQPYEGKEFETSRTDECLFLGDDDYQKGPFTFCGRNLELKKLSSQSDLSHISEEDILMCFRGGLTNEGKDPIYQPGDVVVGKIFKQLSEEFEVVENSLILVVSQ
jgi:mannose-6-phosphate isomerase-like protein (cupin superfamily)